MARRARTDADMKMKRRKRTSKKREFDINRQVNIAVRTGKTIIGSKSLLKYINTNDLQVIILAQNCPGNLKERIETLINAKEANRIPIYHYPNSSWDLGTAAGKPHMIAALGIINPGDSSILNVVTQQK